MTTILKNHNKNKHINNNSSCQLQVIIEMAHILSQNNLRDLFSEHNQHLYNKKVDWIWFKN